MVLEEMCTVYVVDIVVHGLSTRSSTLTESGFW